MRKVFPVVALLTLASAAGCTGRTPGPQALPQSHDVPGPASVDSSLPRLPDDLPEPVKAGYRRALAAQADEARVVEPQVVAADDRLTRVEAGRVDAGVPRDVVYHAGTWAFRTADAKSAAVAAARDEARLARARLDRLRDPLAVDVPDIPADAARPGSFGTLTGTLRRIDAGGKVLLDANFPAAGRAPSAAAAADDPGYGRQDVVLDGVDAEGKSAGDFLIVPVLLESTTDDAGRTLLRGRAFPPERVLGH